MIIKSKAPNHKIEGFKYIWDVDFYMLSISAISA